MNITGNKIILRAIEENDLTLLHRWANDPETQMVMGSSYFPSSMDFHREWFAKLRSDRSNQRLAIHAPEHGIIGISSLIQIDWQNRHAWHGVMLGDADVRGKGFGIDAVMATMRFAFDELGLERLDGSIIEYNERSYKFYCNKLGWKEEGRRRRWYFHQGRYWDQIVVGITVQDYKDLIGATRYWDN